MSESGDAQKKLVVGWFSFTCCEDSTILFCELLNDHFDQWKDLIEFRHVKALRTDNKLEGLDVAFIEGAASSPSQEAEMKEIRANAKAVVGIGNCACIGQPSNARNLFTDAQIDERIQWYYDNFDYGEVKKLADVIQVDFKVPGCPMKAETFLQTVDLALKKFGIIPDEAGEAATAGA